MKLREVADLLDVSSKELIDALITEVHDLDVEPSLNTQPNNVLPYKKSRKNNGKDLLGSSETDQHETDNVTWTPGNTIIESIKNMSDRGKICVGFVLVLLDYDHQSYQTKQIYSLLWEIGNETIKTKTNDLMQTIDGFFDRLASGKKKIVPDAIPLLPGITSIYLSVVNRWLNENTKKTPIPTQRNKPERRTDNNTHNTT